MNKGRGRGRPAKGADGTDATDTRGAILKVARARFLSDGYERVTMRSLAAEAGVDAALISYRFGSKRGLFAACMELSTNPADLLAEALSGPAEGLPERMIANIIRVWDDPEAGAALRALAEAAVSEPDVSRLFREMAEREMIGRIADRLSGPDAPKRAALAASQLIGLVFIRYVLRLEPLASMPPDELTTRTAPSLRTALTTPRPPAPARMPRPNPHPPPPPPT
ncbi:TetR family transcriptional regulator [Streptomyces sp. CA-111067]|uniref:TetR/AcrR family transcriptional regulator n=1 Tax=Streptomyces sp. CA-111067 TaxID=3240046 RepID=UPI003D957A48